MATENPPWDCPVCGTHYEGKHVPWPLGGEGATRYRPAPPVGECKVCNGAERQRFLHEVQDRDRQRVVDLFMEWSAIGPEYRACGFDNFTPRPGTEAAAAASRAYVEQFGAGGERSLLIFGPPGSGKTHLAMAIRAEIERRDQQRRRNEREQWAEIGRSSDPMTDRETDAERWVSGEALAITQPYFLAKVRDSWDRPAGAVDLDYRPEGWIRDRLLHARLLIWDDLMEWPPWAFDRLFVIFDGRYRLHRPTVLTSNHTPEELHRFMDARLWSRMIARTEFVGNRGSDYRAEVERRRVVNGG